MIDSEETIKAAVRRHHENLTANELELYCQIMDDMLVNDISNLQHVAVSSVTAHQSRLRKKIGLG